MTVASLASTTSAAGVPAGFDALDQESAVRTLEKTARANGAIGFYTDAAGDFVVVVPSRIANTFALPSALHVGLDVRVESKDIQANEIVAAKARLDAIGSDATTGVGSLQFWFDPERGKVVAEGSADSETVARLLGPSRRFVAYSKKARPVRFSRHGDTAPFWGGAETQRVGLSGFQCTTGFTVKKPTGFQYLVTAGHCFLDNTTVISPGTSQTQGKIVLRAGYPQFDMELIGTKTYGPSIYVGPGGGVGMHVKGAGDAVEGRPIYCHSGAATLQQCNHTVVDLNGGTACDQNGNNCTHDLMVVSQGDKTPCSGDSGGPIFLISGGNAYIRGMVIGGNFFCFGDWYGHRWSSISTQLSVSIVTG
jgi:hypothetical protein